VVGLAGVLILGGCAKRAPLPPATVTTGSTSTATGGSREQEVRTTAEVEKVDVANRLVTLRRPDGNTVTVRVGQHVADLRKVKRGDRVVVVSYESIAFQILKPDEGRPSLSWDDDVLIPSAESPRGGSIRETTLVAKIVRLDRAKQQAMLRGPEGKTVTVDVQNPENFDKVKVGDTVEVTYTEAYGIEGQAAP